MRWSNSAAEPCPPPRWCSDGAAARRPGNGRRPRRQDRRSPACRSGHPILRPMLAAWQRHRDAGFVTRKDLRAVEVAAIGDGFEHLCLQNSLRLLGDIGKLCSIRAAFFALGHKLSLTRCQGPKKDLATLLLGCIIKEGRDSHECSDRH